MSDSREQPNALGSNLTCASITINTWVELPPIHLISQFWMIGNYGLICFVIVSIVYRSFPGHTQLSPICKTMNRLDRYTQPPFITIFRVLHTHARAHALSPALLWLSGIVDTATESRIPLRLPRLLDTTGALICLLLWPLHPYVTNYFVFNRAETTIKNYKSTHIVPWWFCLRSAYVMRGVSLHLPSTSLLFFFDGPTETRQNYFCSHRTMCLLCWCLFGCHTFALRLAVTMFSLLLIALVLCVCLCVCVCCAGLIYRDRSYLQSAFNETGLLVW